MGRRGAGFGPKIPRNGDTEKWGVQMAGMNFQMRSKVR